MRRVDIGRASVVALAVSLGGAWGCAANEAAAPPANQPAMLREEGEPATLEEAQAQLERARAQLPAPVVPAGPSTAVTTESTPGAGGTATTPAESPVVPEPSASTAERDRMLQAHRCGNACGAMISMRHAVDAICRLAGESDARCTDARRTLKESEGRVAGCGCPAP